jgi:hypothetical protein
MESDQILFIKGQGKQINLSWNRGFRSLFIRGELDGRQGYSIQS